MPDTCRFCQMVHGEVGTPVVYESEASFAFLDNRPLFPGHCLVVPRLHFETLSHLPPSLLGPFFLDVQLVARAVEAGMEAQGTFIAMNNRISQSVPHLHVHVVPRRKGDGLKGFFWPRTRYPDEAGMERVRALLESTIRELNSSESGG